MKLKFLLPSVALFLVASAANAQISLGAQAGAAFAKSSTDDITDISGINLNYKNRVGFSGGLIADIPIGESGLRIIPELYYVQKGLKADGTVSIDILGQLVTADAEADINLSYIDLPVNLAYAIEAGNGRFIIGAGPYAGFGLSGKSKVKVSALGQSEEQTEDVKFGSADDELKQFDYGANFMAAYIMNNGFMVKVNYSLGLANLSNVSDSEWKNRYFGVSLGYFFLRGGE